MKLRQGIVFIILFLLAVIAVPVFGAALDIDQYTHSEDELGILVLTGKTLSRITELEKRPCQVKIAVLQVPGNMLKPEMEKIIMNYVKDGGTVWFYDSRLGPMFDMKSAPLKGKELRYNSQKGGYGDESKHRGAATYLQSYGSHPALKGVNLVLAFLLEVGKDQFSAVEVTEDVIPMLIANDNKTAAAAEKKIGDGKVILKPLLWTEAVDGKRFQTNLLEYSAGYPVPDIKDLVSTGKAENIPPKPDDVDRVLLKNGRYFDGKLENDKFKLETVGEPIKFSPGEIAEVRLRSRMNMDEVITRDGKTYRGVVSWGDELRLKLKNGKVMTFSKLDASSVLFRK